MTNHLETPRHSQGSERELGGSGIAMGGLGIICFLSWVSASAESGYVTGGALTAAGLLMIWKPVRQQVPAAWWIAGSVWLLGSLLAFSPLDHTAWPAWRESFTAAGIETGNLVTPQSLAALGSFMVMAAAGMVALWAVGHSGELRKRLSLGVGFVVAVVIYAFMAWLCRDFLDLRTNDHGTFGFFPNRNHSATLLVMGSLVSLGLLTQGGRWRCPWMIGVGTACLVFLIWVLFSQSISRGGILLLATGSAAWTLLVRPRYLGGHVGKAVGLALGGAALIFLMLDSPVRHRLDETFRKISQGSDADGSGNSLQRLENFDARIAIQRDTATMILDAPLSGWGPGQFAFIFPQYQSRTASQSRNEFLHPESDWLWMAAENGIPATLALAVLALAVFVPALKDVRQGRSRALRAGFLVAAAVVPLHGLFDVPGHQFSLLWCSAILLSLAACPRPLAKFPLPYAIGWRLAGAAVATLGAVMLHADLKGTPLLASERANKLFNEANESYREDRLKSAAAMKAGEDPSIVDPDPLEIQIRNLQEAVGLMPLDPRIRGLLGMLALHFDHMDATARDSFAMQRVLDPIRINLPLAQADAWAKIDPLETRSLWLEAMERAASMEERFPGTDWKIISYTRILQRARGSAELAGVAIEAAGEDTRLLRLGAEAPHHHDAKHAH